MSKRPNRMDLCFLIIITVFFILFFVMSFSLTRIAGTVPKLITGIAGILCLVLLIKEFLPKKSADEKPEEEPAVLQGIPVYKTLFILVGYIIALLVLGFPLSTFLVLVLWPILLGYKNHVRNIVYSAITTGVLYYAVHMFYIRMPVGILFERIFK